jgi:hypothetical protein
MGAVSPEFCLASFIGVSWAFTIYLAYHVGRGLEARSWDASYRRQRTQMFASPWWTGLERESDFSYINGKCGAQPKIESPVQIGTAPQLPSPLKSWRKPLQVMARLYDRAAQLRAETQSKTGC